MDIFKNKLVIILIIAVIAGGAVGLYLAKTQKPVTETVSTGSGVDPQKVGEVIKKLNNLTND